jgi:hypothetical protein
MTIHHFCAQGIPTVIIMAEYFKTLGPSKCNTIYTMVSWLWALVDLVDLWQLPKVFPRYFQVPIKSSMEKMVKFRSINS